MMLAQKKKNGGIEVTLGLVYIEENILISNVFFNSIA